MNIRTTSYFSSKLSSCSPSDRNYYIKRFLAQLGLDHLMGKQIPNPLPDLSIRDLHNAVGSAERDVEGVIDYARELLADLEYEHEAESAVNAIVHDGINVWAACVAAKEFYQFDEGGKEAAENLLEGVSPLLKDYALWAMSSYSELGENTPKWLQV